MISPRFVRYRDAPAYFGMDRNRFDANSHERYPAGQRWQPDRRQGLQGTANLPTARHRQQNDAEAWLSARQAEIDAQRANALRRGGQHLWADAARKYLRECQTRKVRTLDLISFHVQLLLPYIGALPLRQVCNESLEQFKLERQEEGRKNSTINRTLEVVRSTRVGFGPPQAGPCGTAESPYAERLYCLRRSHVNPAPSVMQNAQHVMGHCPISHPGSMLGAIFAANGWRAARVLSR